LRIAIIKIIISIVWWRCWHLCICAWIHFTIHNGWLLADCRYEWKVNLQIYKLKRNYIKCICIGKNIWGSEEQTYLFCSSFKSNSFSYVVLQQARFLYYEGFFCVFAKRISIIYLFYAFVKSVFFFITSDQKMTHFQWQHDILQCNVRFYFFIVVIKQYNLLYCERETDIIDQYHLRIWPLYHKEACLINDSYYFVDSIFFQKRVLFKQCWFSAYTFALFLLIKILIVSK
jgi:hypothetical protein